MAQLDDDAQGQRAPGSGVDADLYRASFDHSPVAILVSDAAGQLVDVNPAACALTGYGRAELLERGIADLAPPGGRVGFELFRQVAEQGRGAAELRLRSQDGTLRWVVTEGVRLGADRLVAFCRDVTEQRAATEALRRERALFAQVMDTSPVAIVTVDGAGRLTLVNRWAVEHLGAPATAAGARYDDPQWRLTAPDGGPLRAEDLPFTRVLAGGVPVRDLRLAAEWPPGQRRQLSVNAAPLVDEAGAPVGLVCVIEDITARLEAERELQTAAERLRQLASEASLAEERERRRVATELHDRIAQPLAMAMLRLRALLPRVAAPDLAAPLTEVCGLLDGALGDTRSLTFAISSPILYDLGFEAALEWLAEQLQSRHGVACTFADDGTPKPLAADLRVVLYQAARELCTNVAKHAGARHASVSVGRDGDTVRVEVADDGVGFPPEVVAARAAATRGFGLFSVRERLRHLGGDLAIESAPGAGSRVVLRAPLDAPRATAAPPPARPA